MYIHEYDTADYASLVPLYQQRERGKRGGGLGSRTIFKKFNEPYAPS